MSSPIIAGSANFTAFGDEQDVWLYASENHAFWELPPTPSRLGLQDVTGIAVGFFFALFVHADGHVSAFGQNLHAQFGVPTRQATSPIRLPLEGIVEVAVSFRHVMARDAHGEVWVAGNVRGHQVPHSQVFEPLGVKATSIAASAFGSLVVTSDGDVLAMGQGSSGALGLGPGSVSYQELTDTGVDGTKVLSSDARSVVLQADGTMLMSGGYRTKTTERQADLEWSVPLPSGHTFTKVDGVKPKKVLVEGLRVLVLDDVGRVLQSGPAGAGLVYDSLSGFTEMHQTDKAAAVVGTPLVADDIALTPMAMFARTEGVWLSAADPHELGFGPKNTQERFAPMCHPRFFDLAQRLEGDVAWSDATQLAQKVSV